jgi:hypothetical protein
MTEKTVKAQIKPYTEKADKEDTGNYQIVTIVAENVRNVGDGTFEVMFRSHKLLSMEESMLRSLFPNMLDAAYNLLRKEALLQSIRD